MKSGWEQRLREAVAEDGRSDRAISVASGLGVNYLGQTFKKGTSPVKGKLAAVLDVLGEEAALYVYTGVRANKEALVALNLLAKVPDDLRGSAMELLVKLVRETQQASLSREEHTQPAPDRGLAGRS